MNDINVILADHPGLGHVRLCECNSIYLAVGSGTINLCPAGFPPDRGPYPRCAQPVGRDPGSASSTKDDSTVPTPNYSSMTH